MEEALMTAIVSAAQGEEAASCRALFTAGGRIRVWTPLFGVRKAKLEEKLRWVVPPRYEVLVLVEDRP